ncbi:MAG TPA: hypothetical protein VFW95_05980 [Candidatus Limnocylindria bacterium]|nr:hypothetical protein [Candidatus Limnocylindria bacterium]
MRVVVTTDDGEEVIFEGPDAEARLRAWLGVPYLSILTPQREIPVVGPSPFVIGQPDVVHVPAHTIPQWPNTW